MGPGRGQGRGQRQWMHGMRRYPTVLFFDASTLTPVFPHLAASAPLLQCAHVGSGIAQDCHARTLWGQHRGEGVHRVNPVWGGESQCMHARRSALRSRHSRGVISLGLSPSPSLSLGLCLLSSGILQGGTIRATFIVTEDPTPIPSLSPQYTPPGHGHAAGQDDPGHLCGH